MNRWLDIALVATAVLVSAGYAAYSLGPKRIKDTFSRLATKYFGLRAAHWFTSARQDSHNCDKCPAHTEHKKT